MSKQTVLIVDDEPDIRELLDITLGRMGLYLCKELCEINNADLSYRITASGESCFRIALNQRTS